MAKAVATPGIDIELIERLEEKVKLLVSVIERMRSDSARQSDEIARLSRELDATRSRLMEAEGAGAEITALREERDLIRSRVDEMLHQIEALNL